jgi:pentatricopeptide repeat protein
MAREGIEPNMVTFTVVLSGCSHSGLLDLARSCGESLHRRSCGSIPSSEQSACLVDLFGRAGRFDEAFALIRAMPTSCDYLPLWSSLLGACQKWGNPELARLTFEHALQLDESYASSYIGMCNVY